MSSKHRDVFIHCSHTMSYVMSYRRECVVSLLIQNYYYWSELVLCSVPSVPQLVFTIMEKAPARAFSWLKVPTSAFTFKTLC